jgi:hypothetical protein
VQLKKIHDLLPLSLDQAFSRGPFVTLDRWPIDSDANLFQATIEKI